MFYPILAEVAETTGPAPFYDSGVMWYMNHGGIFMWPILILAIIGLAVVIERYRSLRMLTTDNLALRKQVLELLHADKVEEAMELCNQNQGPVAAILSVGLRRFLLLRRLNYDAARIEEQVVKSMDDYGVHIVAALERHLPILSTISAVAPMLGSVGTVVGMVILFQDIAIRAGAENIVKAAAAGIQVKLLVTVWGLLVGIPAYIFFNYFTTTINRYVLHVEETATELIEAVTLQMALREQQAKATAKLAPGAAVGHPAGHEAVRPQTKTIVG
jgi:biopolymer transport protein ExbB